MVLLGPNIFLSTLFSNILSLRSFPNIRNKASHPHKTTAKLQFCTSWSLHFWTAIWKKKHSTIPDHHYFWACLSQFIIVSFCPCLNTYEIPMMIIIISSSSSSTSIKGPSPWPWGLRRRSAAAHLLRSWVQIPPGAWMFVVSVVCCQVEVSATSWSLVQRRPTNCDASVCMI